MCGCPPERRTVRVSPPRPAAQIAVSSLLDDDEAKMSGSLEEEQLSGLTRGVVSCGLGRTPGAEAGA